MIQPSLFAGVNAHGDPIIAPSRHTDPASSHDAGRKYAASGKLRGCKAIVLAILNRAGRPLTYRETWDAATDDERVKLREANIVMRRLNDLRRAGLVKNGATRVCAVSGETVQTWEGVG